MSDDDWVEASRFGRTVDRHRSVSMLNVVEIGNNQVETRVYEVVFRWCQLGARIACSQHGKRNGRCKAARGC